MSSMMVDWISCNIPLLHNPIPAGEVISITSDGEFEYSRVKPSLFEGSFSDKIVLRSQGDRFTNGLNNQLFLSGNPSKFLQGHNVFGITNIQDLLFGVFRYLHKTKLIDFDLLDIYSAIPAATVSRVDLTRSIKFQNRNQCRAYIHQLSTLAHTKSGRPHQTKWTLHFNPKSKRWNAVIYSKGDEVGNHSFHPSFEHKDYIKGQADSLVRVEIRVKTLELIRMNLRKVMQLTPSVLDDLYSTLLERLKMSETVEITQTQLSELSPTYQASYLKWKAGIDLQAEMTHNTYYTHRRKILTLGCDISVPYSFQDTAQILPLKQVLKGELYEIPDEAREKGLVFQPEQLRLISSI